MFNVEELGGQSQYSKLSLYCGPQLFRPVLINPDRKALNAFLESDKKTDEINYYSQTTINGEEVDSLRINLWGWFTKEDGTEYKGCLDPIWLKNKVRTSTKDPNVTKYCYINAFGRTSWVPEGGEFPQFFYSKNVKKSIYGEEMIMDFVISLLGINTYFDASKADSLPSYITEGKTFVDIDKLFNKDYSDIQSLLDRFCTDKTDIDPKNPNYMRKMIALAVVRTRKDNGELSQGYYTGKFGRAKFEKTKFVSQKSDVNQIINRVNTQIKDNQFSHNGVITDVLTIFDPNNIAIATTENDVPW